MKEENNNVMSGPVLSGGNRKTFKESLNLALDQIEWECFDRASPLTPLYRELILIISEVYALDPHDKVRIAGETLPVTLVQEVYRELTKEHVELVADNFDTLTREIKFKKSYLRTALYNSVFELESYWINKINSEKGNQ